MKRHMIIILFHNMLIWSIFSVQDNWDKQKYSVIFVNKMDKTLALFLRPEADSRP